MLTQFKIKHVPKNKKVGDGRGLYFLKVGPGRGRWTYRYMMNGRAREMGFGPFPEISLDEARHMREDCRDFKFAASTRLRKDVRRYKINSKLRKLNSVMSPHPTYKTTRHLGPHDRDISGKPPYETMSFLILTKNLSTNCKSQIYAAC